MNTRTVWNRELVGGHKENDDGRAEKVGEFQIRRKTPGTIERRVCRRTRREDKDKARPCPNSKRLQTDALVIHRLQIGMLNF